MSSARSGLSWPASRRSVPLKSLALAVGIDEGVRAGPAGAGAAGAARRPAAGLPCACGLLPAACCLRRSCHTLLAELGGDDLAVGLAGLEQLVVRADAGDRAVSRARRSGRRA